MPKSNLAYRNYLTLLFATTASLTFPDLSLAQNSGATLNDIPGVCFEDDLRRFRITADNAEHCSEYEQLVRDAGVLRDDAPQRQGMAERPVERPVIDVPGRETPVAVDDDDPPVIDAPDEEAGVRVRVNAGAGNGGERNGGNAASEIGDDDPGNSDKNQAPGAPPGQVASESGDRGQRTGNQASVAAQGQAGNGSGNAAGQFKADGAGEATNSDEGPLLQEEEEAAAGTDSAGAAAGGSGSAPSGRDEAPGQVKKNTSAEADIDEGATTAEANGALATEAAGATNPNATPTSSGGAGPAADTQAEVRAPEISSPADRPAVIVVPVVPGTGQNSSAGAGGNSNAGGNSANANAGGTGGGSKGGGNTSGGTVAGATATVGATIGGITADVGSTTGGGNGKK